MVTERRGQLLLVVAILMALAIVASVTLLNSIYTPAGLSTGDVGEDTQQIEYAHDELQEGLREHFERASAIDDFGSPQPYLNSLDEDEFRNGTRQQLGTLYGDLLSQSSDALVTLNYTGGVTGDGVIQARDRNLSSSGSDGNWTMFTDVDRVVVANLSLTRLTATPTTFTATGASGDIWRMNVSEDGVRVEGDGVANRSLCSPSDTADEIHISTREERGRPVVTNTTGSTIQCDRLQLGAGVTPPYELAVTNGRQTSGTYAFTAVGDVSLSNAAPITSGDSPVRREDAIINPTFEVTYVGSSISYESTFTLYNRTGS